MKQLVIDNQTWPHFSLEMFYLHLFALIWAPFMHLYLHGPSFPILGGFWRGKSLSEICYSLTNDMDYERINQGRCAELLFNGFESYYTALHFGILGIFIIYVIQYFHNQSLYFSLADRIVSELKFVLNPNQNIAKSV